YRIDITRTSTISQFAADLASLVAKYRTWFDGMMTWLTGSGDVAILNPDTGANVTIPSWKKVASEGEGQTARAKVEADRAKTEADRALTEADRAAGIVAAASLPLPDVWAPLSDSLRLITGYGRDVLVGSDVVARMVNFSRNSTATYIGKDGQLKTAAANEPRFEKEGLLVEGQSTNIVTNSNVFTPYGAGATKIDQQPGPFGANDATRIDTVNPYQGTNPPLSSSLVDGAVYTSSVWLRGAVGGENIRIGIHNSTTGVRVTLTTEWKRYSVTQTRAAGTNAAFVIQAESAAVSFFVYGAQMETLPFASSYIPTAGAAVTRAQDICWIPVQNAGLQGLANEKTMSVVSNIIGVANNFGFILTTPWGAIGYTRAQEQVYGVNTSLSVTSPVRINQQIRRVARFTKGGGATGLFGNNRKDTETGDWMIGNISRVSIGSHSDSSNLPHFGHVRDLKIWLKPLSDEQIKAVA
ncbi:hypothetical protein, partial [Aeromonas sp. PrichA-15]|uniref:phage head spike fiber domain-containing protein n=1 Tax=Aeromonas sp. PrichA-15 TaxID=2823360 RepID=UPI001B32ACD6